MRKFPPKFSLFSENEYTKLVSFIKQDNQVLIVDNHGDLLDISPNISPRKIRRIFKKIQSIS